MPKEEVVNASHPRLLAVAFEQIEGFVEALLVKDRLLKYILPLFLIFRDILYHLQSLSTLIYSKRSANASCFWVRK